MSRRSGPVTGRAATGPRTAVAALAVAALALAVLVLGAAPASAHALAVSSVPQAGSAVRSSPATVQVTFGEHPDPKLSSLRVLDSSGRNRAAGPTRPVPGQPLSLEVPVEHLASGVYSVVWTTVSSVDGHLAGGTFAFGVGVSAADLPAARTTSSAPAPSPWTSVARWLLYAGLMGLVGGAAVGLACFGHPRRPAWPWLFVAAWVVAVLGGVGIGLGEARSAHLGLSQVARSTFGHQIQARVVPLVAGLVLAVVADLVAPRAWRRRVVVAVLGLAGLAAMWGDVSDSHAAAAHSDLALKMVEQWLHFVAAGVWIGGLVLLLIGLLALRPTERGRVVGRYSNLALGAVAVLALSGTLRAIDEVGSWHALFATSFGRLILVKSGLLVALVGLGAANRYRTVRHVQDTPRPLLRLGRVELGVVAVVLVATALLQGLAPPATVAAAPAPLVVTGHDFATTVKVRLTISPGTVGFNQFDLAADDYDTGRPVVADPVTLTFSRPDRPDVGASTLTLRRAADGTYQGSGPNLALAGTWRVAVLVQQRARAAQIDLSVTPRSPPQHVTVNHSPGIPDLYTISLATGGSVQVYLDPGQPGLNELHVTYVGADGKETPTRSAQVVATGPSAAHRGLPVRRLDTIGHFVADLTGATRGSYRFDISGTFVDGSTATSSIAIPVR